MPASAAAPAPSPALTRTLIAVMCLIWGSTWLVIKVGLESVPPFTGAAARFVVAGTCMAVLCRLFAAREGGGKPPAVAVWANGLAQFAFNFGVVYLAETVIPSGLVAVLWAVFPIFVALGGHFVLRTERIDARKTVGIALSFAGVAALFATDLAAIDARAIQLGLWVLLAPLSVSVSTLLVKTRAAGSSSLLLNRDSMLIGAAVLGAIAFLFEDPLAVTWTAPAIASVLYLALVGTVFTFGTYMWLLRYVPAYQMSLTSFVIPVVALAFGALIGGERPGVHTLLGTALVLSGLGVTRGGAPRSTSRAESP